MFFYGFATYASFVRIISSSNGSSCSRKTFFIGERTEANADTVFKFFTYSASSSRADAFPRIDIKKVPLDYDIIAVSDYNKGFLAEDDIQYLCEHHYNVFIDTKKTSATANELISRLLFFD